MDVRFRNRKLRELCEIRMRAERRLGTGQCEEAAVAFERSGRSRQRCRAPRGPAPYPEGRTKGSDSRWTWAAGCGWCSRPDQEPCPRHADGGIDWSRVTVIRIEAVEDYHD